MNIVISALWVFTGILSPLMALFLYPFIRRMPRLCSPAFAIPAVTLVCFAFTVLPISPARYLYPHFAIAGLVLVTAYILLLRLGLKAPDALLTATMTILATDTLWQIPIDVGLWRASVLSAATGLATGGFSLMSIPLVFFFLGRVKLDVFSRGALAFALAATVLGVLTWHPFPGFDWDPYWLVWPWTAFFFLLFRSSWAGVGTLDAARPHIPALLPPIEDQHRGLVYRHLLGPLPPAQDGLPLLAGRRVVVEGDVILGHLSGTRFSLPHFRQTLRPVPALRFTPHSAQWKMTTGCAKTGERNSLMLDCPPFEAPDSMGSSVRKPASA